MTDFDTEFNNDNGIVEDLYVHNSPAKEKLMTTDEVCKGLGICRSSLSQIKKRMGVTGTFKITHRAKICLYTYQEYRILKSYMDKAGKNVTSHMKKHIDTNKNEDEQILFVTPELKSAHPLVKDERFFNLTYFPNVIPVCFQEEQYL